MSENLHDWSLGLLTTIGHGIIFVAGAVTEVGFGVISSSMPALNHIIVVTIPQSLSSLRLSGRFGNWLSSGSDNSKSFKDSFHEYTGGTPRNNRGTESIDVCDDEFPVDTSYMGKYGFKHPNIGDNERDLESDPGGKTYY
jgi:hypothetical protein